MGLVGALKPENNLEHDLGTPQSLGKVSVQPSRISNYAYDVLMAGYKCTSNSRNTEWIFCHPLITCFSPLGSNLLSFVSYSRCHSLFKI